MYSQGKGKTVGPLLIHCKKNELGISRLGLSVPKKVGNAVQRNRVKRKCREAFRLTIPILANWDRSPYYSTTSCNTDIRRVQSVDTEGCFLLSLDNKNALFGLYFASANVPSNSSANHGWPLPI